MRRIKFDVNLCIKKIIFNDTVSNQQHRRHARGNLRPGNRKILNYRHFNPRERPYRIKVPQEGLVFTAKTAKARGSVLGDGILFRVLVREKAGAPAECAAEMTVKDYVWHDFRADLSRWAGRSVELILVGDPGLANNTLGDGGGWADMRLEVKPSVDCTGSK